MTECVPPLTVSETGGIVRLQLGGIVRGEGVSLREAADDLIRRLLDLVIAFRSSGLKASCEVGPDLEMVDFLYQLGELAASGGDIRARVFG